MLRKKTVAIKKNTVTNKMKTKSAIVGWKENIVTNKIKTKSAIVGWKKNTLLQIK